MVCYKVPILTFDGEQMVDSSGLAFVFLPYLTYSDIIDKLIKRIDPDYDLNGNEEKKWSGCVDNHLVHIFSQKVYQYY
ncbi:Prostaglandin E synthase 2 [Quillaja saponaria]|uniref:Prostaglandin E synthase 2 n=1 Tax=Quillaja saponaria TaxID=32244 RepID=A0AAD7LZ43_QUISA|nr:Prostaglandin E synthase 2 [Quillaja saponaria]